MAETEQALLERYASARDAEAFRELVERHRDMVFGTCRRILGNAPDAEDAAQDCFLQFLRKADGLRAPIGGWLHHVAAQTAINLFHQRSARKNRDVKAARLRSPDREASWEDIKEAVDGAIAELPDELRAPIVMHYLEGCKLEEIGAELGITGPAVSKRLSRGVEKLQARLRKGGGCLGAALLAGLLASKTADAAPPTLVASLGKMALASHLSPAAGGTAAGNGAAAGSSAVKAALLAVVVGAALVTAAAMFLLPIGRPARPLAPAVQSPVPLPQSPRSAVAEPQPLQMPDPLFMAHRIAAGADLIYLVQQTYDNTQGSAPAVRELEKGKFSGVLRIVVAEVDAAKGALLAETIMGEEDQELGPRQGKGTTDALWTGRLKPGEMPQPALCWSGGGEGVGERRVSIHVYHPSGVAAHALVYYPVPPPGVRLPGNASWPSPCAPIYPTGIPFICSGAFTVVGIQQTAGRPCALIRGRFQPWSAASSEREALVDVEHGFVAELWELFTARLPKDESKNRPESGAVRRWNIKLYAARILPPDEMPVMIQMISGWEADSRRYFEAIHIRAVPITDEFRRAGDALLERMKAGIPKEAETLAARQSSMTPPPQALTGWENPGGRP